MPYVVGTYRDKWAPPSHAMLSDENHSLAVCRQRIRWQTGGGSAGTMDRTCSVPQSHDRDMRTCWHICDALPEAFAFKCRGCGEVLHVERGAYTWEAFHEKARGIWGNAVPLTVAELRLAWPKPRHEVAG